MPINKFSAKSLDTDVPDKPLIFLVEGRYQNWIKPVILLESLQVDYDTACLDGPDTRTDWYTRIHPQRYLPAILDAEDGKRVISWDSSQILQYLANKYDSEKLWIGTNATEQLEIGNWLTFENLVAQLPSIGSGMRSASLKTRIPRRKKSKFDNHASLDETLSNATIFRMLGDLRVQYGILEQHLSKPGQLFIGLKDRPTIADISVYPFADDPTMARMGIDKNDFPALKAWSERFAKLPGVAKAYAEIDSRKNIVIGE